MKKGIILIVLITIVIIVMTTITSAEVTQINNYTDGKTSVALDNEGYLYIGNGAGIAKLNATSLELISEYTYPGDSEDNTFNSGSIPTISGDYIFINSIDAKTIFKINKNTMTLSNSYTNAETMYPPRVFENYVYALTADKKVIQLTESTLSYVGDLTVETNYNEGTQAYPLIEDVGVGTIMVAAGALIIPGDTMNLFQAYTGETGWYNTIPLLNNGMDGYIYLGTSSGKLRRYNVTSGALLNEESFYSSVKDVKFDGTYIYATDSYTLRKYYQNLTLIKSIGITGYGNDQFGPMTINSEGIIYTGQYYRNTFFEINSADLSYINNYTFSGPRSEMTYIEEENKLYIPSYVGLSVTSTETLTCEPEWTCTEYDTCDIEDEQKCIAVIDNNNCGENYTGNYTEINPLTCDYCTPDWSCIEYSSCVSPATSVGCLIPSDANECNETYDDSLEKTCRYGGGSCILEDNSKTTEEEIIIPVKTETDGTLLSLFGSQGTIGQQTTKDILTIILGISLLFIIYKIINNKKNTHKRGKKR